MRQYKLVQAVPGTDDYGWYLLTLGTDGQWYNFFGRSPFANEHQISRAITNLGSGWTRVQG
jgi:hypothetical protein